MFTPHRGLSLAPFLAVVVAFVAVGAATPAPALANADLSIAVSSTPATTTVGDAVTFVLTVRNLSATPAHDLIIRNYLPGDSGLHEIEPGTVLFKSLETSDPTFTCGAGQPQLGFDGLVTCQLLTRDFAGGESATITIHGTAEVPGKNENVAQVSELLLDDDPSSGDNQARTPITVLNPAGGSGSDKLRGHGGNDQLFGRRGHDILKGFDGDDLLDGGLGNDKLYGGRGKDKLIGGKGNDKLVGGPDKDVMRAGAGSDQINAADGVKEVVDCGSGTDTVTADHNDKLNGCEVKHLKH